jgi:hypothetical protein
MRQLAQPELIVGFVLASRKLCERGGADVRPKAGKLAP